MPKPEECAAAASFRLKIDGREMFVVAVGMQAPDAQQVIAGCLEPKGDARPDFGLWLEVQHKPALRHDPLAQVR